MAHYTLSYANPATQYIDVEYTSAVTTPVTEIALPTWRPGRYELGNFAKNIQRFECYNERNELLPCQKISKSKWAVHTANATQLTIKYNYYAAELNAGSTFLNAEQLYVNPVNCCIYNTAQLNEECTLAIQVPAHYRIAIGLPAVANKINTYTATNFDALADSPFIASASLQRQLFVLDGVEINLWFQGECTPDFSKLINDFFIFINESFVTMGGFTSNEYHFMFQITPYFIHHGVEHLTSTVIALGPGYSLMKKDNYNELLGISCHELFHSWNVKAIRPADMYPYNYEGENYTKLGYVTEGITTYYGDFLLFRSGVFTDADYFETFNRQLDKHFNNSARFNMSVANSSWDTWLDGYVPGVPNRKVSIYTEGCLCAFMLDVTIRKSTQNQRGLEQVMQHLYDNYAKQNKGYTEADYKAVCEQVAEVNLDLFFANYYNGTTNYMPLLTECLEYVGLTLNANPWGLYADGYYGFRYADDSTKCIVKQIYLGSNAELAGLTIGDNILAINGIKLENNLDQWLRYFDAQPVTFTISSNGIIKTITLQKSNADVYYKHYSVAKLSYASAEQKVNYKAWSKQDFVTH
jgi:predicted metalloprotease with PDZ domain